MYSSRWHQFAFPPKRRFFQILLKWLLVSVGLIFSRLDSKSGPFCKLILPALIQSRGKILKIFTCRYLFIHLKRLSSIENSCSLPINIEENQVDIRNLTLEWSSLTRLVQILHIYFCDWNLKIQLLSFLSRILRRSLSPSRKDNSG